MDRPLTQAEKDHTYNGFFRPRSAIWALANEDWSDLTIPQIAEVLDIEETTVSNYIHKLKKEHDIIVAHVKIPPGRKKL